MGEISQINTGIADTKDDKLNQIIRTRLTEISLWKSILCHGSARRCRQGHPLDAGADSRVGASWESCARVKQVANAEQHHSALLTIMLQSSKSCNLSSETEMVNFVRSTD